MIVFMIGTMVVLLCIAIYLCACGVSVMEASVIFIFPVCLFTEYFFLKRKTLKREKERRVVLDMIQMTKNNDIAVINDDYFDELNKSLAENGITLNYNMTGYFS